MDAFGKVLQNERIAIVRTLATPAEIEVLALRIDGFSYPEISERLPGHPHPDALRRRVFRMRQKVKAFMETGRLPQKLHTPRRPGGGDANR